MLLTELSRVRHDVRPERAPANERRGFQLALQTNPGNLAILLAIFRALIAREWIRVLF